MYQAPRGTTDILPSEQRYWNYIREKSAALCHLYGYQRIDTPVFEDMHLFTRTNASGTDIVDKEMYVFTDMGGQQLALKAEGTAPICRAYLEHGFANSPQPVRLYYLGPTFRYERPQAGRSRQHHQFGCEALGDAAPLLDAEIIEMAWQFLLSLGLSDLSLQLNSIGCKSCRPNYIAALKLYYSDHASHLCPDCQVRMVKNPLRLLDCKRPACQKIAEGAPKSTDYLCADCGAHFRSVQQYLEHLDIPFRVNHHLVRGLDYYTRTVFEIQPTEEGGQSTIGAGGRYDDLISQLGGQPSPGVGFAFGIERIILNLQRQGVDIPHTPPPQVMIAHLGQQGKLAAITLASRLRRTGISVVTATGSKSLKSQLRHANTLMVGLVIIIGTQEIKDESIILRDMRSGEQERLPLEGIDSALRARLQSSKLY